MPKILINELDKTSPGTPDDYSNYSVLITGFAASNRDVDYENVYEFKSKEAFDSTIGLVAPKITMQTSNGSQTVCHYGNQMAYELLNLGYSIIYKPINSINEMRSESFWEIFKDRANYDFRFITHGLLESSISGETATRLSEVKAAISALENIAAAWEEYKKNPPPNQDLEEAVFLNEKYNEIRTEYDGFKNGPKTTDRYGSYSEAVIGTEEEKTRLEANNITKDIINEINGNIANLAKYSAETEAGRGDCIALIEIDETLYNNATIKPENAIIGAINEMSTITEDNGKYCALTVPSVHYQMTVGKEFNGNKKFPGAFHYLACFINALKSGFAEWYATAGYTRGVSSYVVANTTVKLGEIAINALEPRNIKTEGIDPKFACNVIANFRGSYYLWGNRTAHKLGDANSVDKGDLTASHFLNIRQLCCTIKKQLYIACRRFTFDPNSDTLWFNFVNAIKPTLEAMKADQGIRDYKILKVYTDKKATLKAKIRIVPIEAVEDFDLEVSLEDSFGETAAVVNE